MPLHAPYCKRNFCGFCGTPLTYWSEDPPEEADYISVTIGSLSPHDQIAIEDLGLLPADSDADALQSPSQASPVVPISESNQRPEAQQQQQPTVRHRSGTIGGIPWFEEMIEGSRLGQYGRRRQGRGRTADSSVQIEWEVSEWYGGDQAESAASTGELREPEPDRPSAKRKSPEVRANMPGP